MERLWSREVAQVQVEGEKIYIWVASDLPISKHRVGGALAAWRRWKPILWMK
jgi:hypothetical protein